MPEKRYQRDRSSHCLCPCRPHRQTALAEACRDFRIFRKTGCKLSSLSANSSDGGHARSSPTFATRTNPARPSAPPPPFSAGTPARIHRPRPAGPHRRSSARESERQIARSPTISRTELATW